MSEKLRWIRSKSLKRDHLRNYLEELSEKIIRRDYLKENGKEIFDKMRRNEILRQTTRVLKGSINKTCLFAHVWYLSSLNILSRCLLSNISSSLSLLEWFSQKVLLNNLSNDFFSSFSSVFNVVSQTITTKITTKSSLFLLLFSNNSLK